MAIGERIHFFRTRKGLTQRQLGEALGFLGRTSDVRVAQYESESRIPREDLIKRMAAFLDVDPRAITVPDIDTYIGLMYTFFTLEDRYGLYVSEIDGELCLRLDKQRKGYFSMFKMLHAWLTQRQRLQAGEISQEEYDTWRYHYPAYDTEQRWAKVPPEFLFPSI